MDIDRAQVTHFDSGSMGSRALPPRRSYCCLLYSLVLVLVFGHGCWCFVTVMVTPETRPCWHQQLRYCDIWNAAAQHIYLCVCCVCSVCSHLFACFSVFVRFFLIFNIYKNQNEAGTHALRSSNIDDLYLFRDEKILYIQLGKNEKFTSSIEILILFW